MTSKEYMIAKNNIIYKYIKMPLVPDSQIIDIPVTREMVISMMQYTVSPTTTMMLDSFNCLYCSEYFSFIFLDCVGCPMGDNDNKCNRSPNSTYDTCDDLLSKLPKDLYHEVTNELQELAKQFIKANKHLL